MEQVDRDKFIIKGVAQAIVETVRDVSPDGAPEGVLYAACMGVMDIHTFRAVIDMLVRGGQLRRTGFLLFIGKTGE